MTGPLAEQFAQVRGCIGDLLITTERYADAKVAEENALAALSVIERHVQDTETALEQASECCARPSGVCFDPAAVPAREKGTET